MTRTIVLTLSFFFGMAAGCATTTHNTSKLADRRSPASEDAAYTKAPIDLDRAPNATEHELHNNVDPASGITK